MNMQEIYQIAFEDELQKIAGDYVSISASEIASKADVKAGRYKRREPIFGRRVREKRRAKMMAIIKPYMAKKD